LNTPSPSQPAAPCGHALSLTQLRRAPNGSFASAHPHPAMHTPRSTNAMHSSCAVQLTTIVCSCRRLQDVQVYTATAATVGCGSQSLPPCCAQRLVMPGSRLASRCSSQCTRTGSASQVRCAIVMRLSMCVMSQQLASEAVHIELACSSATVACSQPSVLLGLRCAGGVAQGHIKK
jgi:hypothetical protein